MLNEWKYTQTYFKNKFLEDSELCDVLAQGIVPPKNRFRLMTGVQWLPFHGRTSKRMSAPFGSSSKSIRMLLHEKPKLRPDPAYRTS